MLSFFILAMYSHATRIFRQFEIPKEFETRGAGALAILSAQRSYSPTPGATAPGRRHSGSTTRRGSGAAPSHTHAYLHSTHGAERDNKTAGSYAEPVHPTTSTSSSATAGATPVVTHANTAPPGSIQNHLHPHYQSATNLQPTSPLPAAYGTPVTTGQPTKVTIESSGILSKMKDKLKGKKNSVHEDVGYRPVGEY